MGRVNLLTSCCIRLAARVQVGKPRRDTHRNNRRASRNVRLHRSDLRTDRRPYRSWVELANVQLRHPETGESPSGQ